jgi:tetratricopeptide (TPR) repeat protein
MNDRMATAAQAGGLAGQGPETPASVANRRVVRIHLLGALRATSCLGHNVLPAGKRGRALLGYLCLAPGEVDRARIASLLWEGVSIDTARTNLRQAVRELSTALGEFADEVLINTRDSLRLRLDACWIDALAARDFDVRRTDDSAMVRAFCRGELMEDLDGVSKRFDEWLLRERLRMTERQRQLLEKALPLAEPASAIHRGLAQLLDETTDRATALAGYTRHGEALALRHAAAHDRDRLRVGVLPFISDGTASEDDLAFSLAQEISSALSRFRWFDSITLLSYRPNRSMRFVDEHRLLNMHLHYIVDGTVSGRGSYLQISVRLMDINDTVRPAWADEFRLARNQLHRLNELVTTKIVACIDPVILSIEGQPNRRDRFGATGMLLLAIPLLYSMERRKYEEAGELIKKAYAREPENSMTAAWVAHWHLFYVGQGWAQDTAETLAVVREYAEKAVQLDPENAEALGIFAHCCAYGDKDFDTAIKYFDRALRLNPSLAFIWAYSALTHCYIGDPDEALRRLVRYRELAPVDPYFSLFENGFTIAYAFKGDYERAVLVGRRVVRSNPDFAAGYKPLIASLGHLGRQIEAAPYVAKLLQLEPNFTAERFAQTYPFKRPSDRRSYHRGLVLAGVPPR